MKTQSEKDQLLVRYLLGQLSEEEQHRVEKRYFDDDDFYEQLEVVEDDLIDAYVRERLSPSEREHFEQRFLSFEDRREKVEFAREWRRFVSDKSPAGSKEKAKPHWLGFFYNRAVLIPLAASLVLALGAGLLALRLSQLNRQIELLREERAAQEKAAQELRERVTDEQRRSQQLLEELQAERSRRETKEQTAALPVIASFILSSGLTRGAGESVKFVVPAEATEVRLQVRFRVGDYPLYAAELQTVEGRRVWSQRGLRARARGKDRSVIVTMPARALENKDYILALKGITPKGKMKDVSEYSFRIVR
ncbi:MAG: hypothetical protein AB1631_23045 [Acidobacteriota bacterium]